MMNKLFYEFSIDRNVNTILVKREFAAKRNLVWTAWTTADLLDQWWAAEGWISKTKTMEFREGGHRHYLMSGPEGEKFWGITSYSKIETNINFSGEECFADEDAKINEEYPQSTYQIEFIDDGEHTLIVHKTTYSSREQLESSLQYGFEKGTNDAYSRLDGLL